MACKIKLNEKLRWQEEALFLFLFVYNYNYKKNMKYICKPFL